MMSAMGALLVLAAAVGAAANVRQAMRLRSGELADWLLAVRLLEREMTYGVLPLPRLCTGVAAQVGTGEVSMAFAEVAEALAQGELLQDVWGNLPQQVGGGWHLAAEDWAVLAELGDGLGQSDLAGQKKLLAECEERLTHRLAESRERYARLGRLVSGLGWCGGLLLVCLWL